FEGALAPMRAGRDSFRYTSIAPFRNSGTGRSSRLRPAFVVLAGTAIHQRPLTSLKVPPISSPAKFFRRIGQNARSAIMTPLRTPRAPVRGELVDKARQVARQLTQNVVL